MRILFSGMQKIVRVFDFYTTKYYLMLCAGKIPEKDSGTSQKVCNQREIFGITDQKIHFEESEVFNLQYKNILGSHASE